MDLMEIVASGGLSIAAIFTLIQITPIKVNPWTFIARALGKALNAEVLEKIDQNEAKNARYRILRFNDEILCQKKHTEEHFNQILEDIDMYEIYCKEHPKYPNSKAIFAINNIRKIYQKCVEENLFL